MLEWHVHHLLTQHLASDHPLANSQWGFLSGKSTVGALLATTYDWFQELESGKGVCSVFFDIRKAFDTVPHRKLIEKLCQLDVSLLQTDTKRLYLEEMNPTPSLLYPVCLKDQPRAVALPYLHWWCDKGSPLCGFKAGALCRRHAIVQKDWLSWGLHNVTKGH